MDDQQLLRYSRQLMLPEIDYAGQVKLLEATVMILGAGGLGCTVSQYLAAAGVGRLLLVDDDCIEASNLGRQILYQPTDVGEKKVLIAARRLTQLNPDLAVIPIGQRYEANDQPSWQSWFDQADVIIDASDNFDSRFALAKQAWHLAKPLVSGAAIGFNGQCAVFSPAHHTACYACLFDEAIEQPAQTCSEQGVISPLVGVIGALQAMETVKLICGLDSGLLGQLLRFDGIAGGFKQSRIIPDPACRCCGC